MRDAARSVSPEQLLDEYRVTGDRALRNRVVDDHRWLAVAISRTMHGSEPLEDLVQVAMLAVIKAAERFDSTFGVPFRSYAAVTIRGELRRHYRDASWAVRVPRRLQELRYEVRAASELLRERLGRSPTTPELAAYLLVTTDEIIDCLCADSNFRSLALDDVDAGRRDGGGVDGGYAAIESGAAFEDLVARLPARLERVVVMRFVHQMKQTQIAAELGISQVQVSRLLRRAIELLRSELEPAAT